MKKKKRNATDSTLRNVRAANKRIKKLEERVTILEIDYEMTKSPLWNVCHPVTVSGREKKRGKK
jgi:hypothetical protein